MERKLVFDIAIESNGPAVHLSSETGAVDMIPFGGTVRGRYFRASWSPCGVDTQVLNQAGVRHMSARYMLTGQDSQGQEAHIYVENNGWFPEGAPMPFHTVPTFLTDSPALAPYLHRNQFEGRSTAWRTACTSTFTKSPTKPGRKESRRHAGFFSSAYQLLQHLVDVPLDAQGLLFNLPGA